MMTDRQLQRQTEKLTQCLTRDAERRLKAAAEKKNDDRLLLQIRELDTTVAQKVVERDIDLPQNIIPRQYTTAVWDNIDLSEETLSGKGTTHFTNGILVQRHSYEPDVPLIEPEVRTGRRSFQAQPQSRFNYFHGKRLGPGIFH
ncbi:hypothetical protein HOLleu_03399 [Holothuria leucospilota]|uniref:Uncharacterized protein n=1 Tax=Holothuria leucospilota TaxID=206669 RepID=A0A9Q1HLB7_HOLLE|nr:hypothetical protein HOLleu_03399 [Holothuria leucospilota]